MDFAADLPALYADFGVPVIHTALSDSSVTSIIGLHDQPGVELLGGEFLATDYTVRFVLADLPAGVRRGDALTVDGVSFTAREASQPLLDGLEHIVPLARA